MVDSTEWARVQQRPAARSTVERLNDRSLEYVILTLRAAAVVLTPGVLVALLATVWTLDWRWAVTTVLVLAAAAGSAWAGFRVFANQEWGSG